MSYCECNYDYDRPEFFSQTIVDARKLHKCDECLGPIHKSERYQRSTGKWDGRVETYRECGSCMELRQWAKISMPCFCCNIFGELHETVLEMVRDVSPKVPGFFFEYGRRMVKIKRRREAAP
jgi:hypothetical protein